MKLFDTCKDPVDNLIPSDGYIHAKSFSSTGTSTNIWFDDIMIPQSYAGGPDTDDDKKIYLPGAIYHLGVTSSTHPLVIKNVSSSTVLTRSNTPTTMALNQYCIYSSDSITPNRIDFYFSGVASQGVMSNDRIAFDGYFEDTRITSTFFKVRKFAYPDSTTQNTVYVKPGIYDIILIGGGGGGGHGGYSSSLGSSVIGRGGGGGGSGGIVRCTVNLQATRYEANIGDGGGGGNIGSPDGYVGSAATFETTGAVPTFSISAYGGMGGESSSGVSGAGGRGGRGGGVTYIDGEDAPIGLVTSTTPCIVQMWKQDGWSSTGTTGAGTSTGGRGGGIMGYSTVHASTAFYYGDYGSGGHGGARGEDGLQGWGSAIYLIYKGAF